MSTTSTGIQNLLLRFAPGLIQPLRETSLADCHASPAASQLAASLIEQPVLKFCGIQKNYASVQALRGIDLPVQKGSVLAVLGPNGAGKSTLFGCLLGLTRASSGTILLNGQAIADRDRTRFGYVAERVALYPHRTIRENGIFFARLKGHRPADFDQQIQRVGLKAVQHRKVRQLSKGMLQRLGLAVALCGHPELLVLDEPFNGLDPALLEGLQRILKEEQQRGATLLISTHTMSAVEPLATHIAIILRGRLAVSGTLHELRAAYPGLSLESIYHLIACRGQRALATSNSPATNSPQEQSVSGFCDDAIPFNPEDVLP